MSAATTGGFATRTGTVARATPEVHQCLCSWFLNYYVTNLVPSKHSCGPPSVKLTKKKIK